MMLQRSRIVRQNGLTREAVRFLTGRNRYLGILLLWAVILPAVAQERPDFVWRRGVSGNGARWAAFSADGSLIASAHGNYGTVDTIKLWRVEDETLLGSAWYLEEYPGEYPLSYHRYDGCCWIGWSYYDPNNPSSCSREDFHIFAYSPDGNTFAAGMSGWCTEYWGYHHYSFGKILLLRSDGTSERIDSGRVNSIVFSRDGAVMVYATTYHHYYDYEGFYYGGIVIRRLDNGRSIGIYLPAEDVHHVAISPDGTLLASTQTGYIIDDYGNREYFNTIKLWRVEDGTLVRTIAGDGNRVAFSPDGSLIASWSAGGGTIAFRRVEDGELIRTLHIEVQGSWTGYNEKFAFSPDWSLIASIVGSTIKLWRVSDGSLVHTLVGHGDEVRTLAFSSDGSLLASGGGYRDGTVRIWRVQDGSLMHTLSGHSGVSSVAFSPDARLLISTDSAIKLWNVEDGSLVRTLGERSQPLPLSFSPDGRLLAAKRDRGTIELRRVSDGSLVRIIEQGAPLGSLSFSPDSRLIASGSGDRAVYLWRVEDGSLMYTLSGSGVGSEVVFSPDGSVLASAPSYYQTQRTIGIWRVSDGSLMYTLTGGAFEFSPSGELLALIDGGAVKLFRVEDGSLIRTITGSRPYDDIKFSPDGQLLAAGSRYTDYQEPSKIELWNLEDNTQIGTIHFDVYGCGYSYLPFGSFVFSPDGSVLAVGGGTTCYWRDSSGGWYDTSSVVQLWSLLDYSLIGSFGRAGRLVFSPDGRAIAFSWSYRRGEWQRSRHSRSSQSEDCSGIGLARVVDAEQRRWSHCESNESIQFSPNGQFLAYVGIDGSVVVLRNPYWRSGDVNGDGCVDDADLMRVLFSFGADDGGLEDMNGDNLVDDADLLLVLFNFGSGC